MTPLEGEPKPHAEPCQHVGSFSLFLHVLNAHSGGRNVDAHNFTRLCLERHRHRTTTDFAINNELRTAFVGVIRNLKVFAAMRTGDRDKLVHGRKYSGKILVWHYTTRPPGGMLTAPS